MTRWKLTVEYDGSGFHGWQRQSHALAVQQVLEEAVQKFSGEEVTLYTAGRTDAGVHARANVAHMDLQKQTEDYVIRDALNFHVRPHRVSVLAVEQVPESFHARLSASGRRYQYRLINRRAPLALQAQQAWHFVRPLEIAPMQEAAKLLLGKHDFSTFRAHGCQASSPLRTLDRLDITRDGETINFNVAARSFLYHQVRNMVGTLAMVGEGKWSVADFTRAFAACDRQAGGPTAPPDGLILWEVNYP